MFRAKGECRVISLSWVMSFQATNPDKLYLARPGLHERQGFSDSVVLLKFYSIQHKIRMTVIHHCVQFLN